MYGFIQFGTRRLHLSCRFLLQYAKVKAAEEVAATLGLYETQGERRQRQQEETADYVEIWVRTGMYNCLAIRRF